MSEELESVAAAPAEQKLELIPNTFTCHGHEWSIRFTDKVIAKVQDFAKVDLWKSIEIKNNPLTVLCRDDKLLRDTVYLLIEEQVKSKEIKKEDFYEDFNGDVFDRAYDAIVGGLERFFSAHRRAQLRQTIDFLEKMGRSDLASQEETLNHGLKVMKEVAKEAISKSAPKIRSTMMNAATSHLESNLSPEPKSEPTSSNAAATPASSQET